MNIYVSNLSFNIQDDDLRDLFTPYGEVSSAKIINDKFTGKSRGFGFVEMSDDTAAQAAVTALNGGNFDGRDIQVAEAKPKEQRSGGGGGYSGQKSPFRDNKGGGGFNNNKSYNQNRY